MTCSMTSRDCKQRLCNYTAINKGNEGNCACNGEFQKTHVVCGAKFNICRKAHAGYAQQTLKKRMQNHLSNVMKLANKSQPSNSFAEHFVNHIICEPFKDKHVRDIIEVKVSREYDPIFSSKKFGHNDCVLCMSKLIEIVARMLKYPNEVINKHTEICGSYHRNSRFACVPTL